MDRINLTKYGFIRSKADDFSDDGNRFTCYRVGNIRVSKLVADGRAYISARRDDYKLDYDDYSKLSHYKSLDALNGVDTYGLTEEDLIQLYNNCLAYDREYEEALTKVVWPTVEELAAARKAEVEARKAELEYIEGIFTLDKLANLSDYAAKSFLEGYKNLKRQANPTGTDEEWASSVHKTPYSKSYMKQHASGYNVRPRYDFEKCKEFLLGTRKY